MSTVLAFKNRERSFPAIENGKVAPPRRVTNLERRSREHLTLTEVERLIASAAKAGRHGSRDAMLILVAFRHGLRVGELVTIRWDQVDLQRGTLHVNRKKNGEAGLILCPAASCERYDSSSAFIRNRRSYSSPNVAVRSRKPPCES